MHTARSETSVRCAAGMLKMAALMVLLVIGAYLTAVAAWSGRQPWLGWLSLVPLFLVIRTWRPASALLAGAIWGFAVYAFSAGRPDAVVPAVPASLALLVAIPAVYASAATWLTRRIGFNPFVLGVAWMLAEFALDSFAGLQSRQLGEASHVTPLLHWIGSALGYVFVAFVIALASASVVSAIGRVRFDAGPGRCPIVSPGPAGSLSPQTFFRSPLFAIRPLRPRGPPP